MLVSLSDLKDYLGIPSGDITYDQFLTDQEEIISAAIENYCGRKFLSASYTQTFYDKDFRVKGTDVYNLWTFHYPVSTVTTVKLISFNQDGSTNETTVDATDYILLEKEGKFTKTDGCDRRVPWFFDSVSNTRVEIAYDAGYASTPPEIKDVVFNLVEQRYQKKVNNISINFGQDIQRLSIPGVASIDFDYTLNANERGVAFGMILGNYANVLDFYRSERALVGDIRDNYVS